MPVAAGVGQLALLAAGWLLLESGILAQSPGLARVGAMLSLMGALALPALIALALRGRLVRRAVEYAPGPTFGRESLDASAAAAESGDGSGTSVATLLHRRAPSTPQPVAADTSSGMFGTYPAWASKMAILVPGRAWTCQSTDELVDRVIRRGGWLEPVADVVQRAVGKVNSSWALRVRHCGVPCTAPGSRDTPCTPP
jgi:hypothetical protein